MWKKDWIKSSVKKQLKLTDFGLDTCTRKNKRKKLKKLRFSAIIFQCCSLLEKPDTQSLALLS